MGAFDLSLFLLVATFSPMDLLFYGLAVWEAWRLGGAEEARPGGAPVDAGREATAS